MDNLKLLFRQYQPNKDTPSLVKFLFSRTTTAEVKKEDKLFIKNPDTHYRFILEDLDDKSLVGTITLILEKKSSNRRATIFSVVTRQDKCRKGIGSYMIEKIKKFSKSLDLGILLVSTIGSNEAAINFFRKMGFFEFENLPNKIVIKNGEDFITEKEIFFYYPLKFKLEKKKKVCG